MIVPTDNPDATSSSSSSPYLNRDSRTGRPTVSAVMTSFNKHDDVRRNLESQRRQTVKFDEMVVVDNASSDGTADMIREHFPEVTLIEMPNSSFGACETFNIGFEAATSDYVAILDDDVELPPEWVEKTLAKFAAEPDTTALVSSKVVEPGMPDWFKNHPTVNAERYMATFRGCATLARRDVLERAGYYDERFFIYGNERDLSCRILNLGYRILQFPGVEVKHGTPFGMKQSPRSLYYHVRNLWLYLFKNVAFGKIVGFVFGQLMSPFRKRKTAKSGGDVNEGTDDVTSDAVGTIGFAETVRSTKRGWWVVVKATLNAFLNLPYCLRHRKVCRADDFELPVK